VGRERSGGGRGVKRELFVAFEVNCQCPSNWRMQSYSTLVRTTAKIAPSGLRSQSHLSSGCGWPKSNNN